MQILVTGATGHVGAALCRELVEAGHNVRALVFEPSPVLKGLGIEEVAGDVTRPHTLESAMRGVELVFHLASLISIDPKDALRQHQVNTVGARNVAEAALAAGVKRLVHFSSIESFHRKPTEQPLTESRPRVDEPGISASAYAVTKACGERAIRAVGQKGLEVVVLHPVAIAGPYDLGTSLVGALLRDLYLAKRPFLVRGCFDWVDCRDIAKAAVTAALKGRDGESYILGGHRLTLLELSAIMQRASGIRKRVFVLPLAAVHLAVPGILLAAKVTGKRPLMTHHSLSNLDSPPTVCFDKAKRELDYRIRPFTETVDDSIAYYKTNGLL